MTEQKVQETKSALSMEAIKKLMWKAKKKWTWVHVNKIMVWTQFMLWPKSKMTKKCQTITKCYNLDKEPLMWTFKIWIVL